MMAPPLSKQQAYHARKPWVRHVCWARRRCASTEPERARHYRDKGVKCPLTEAQAAILWRRDGADLMTRPSLDRIDAMGDYEFDNCRFMEFNLNVRLPHDPALADEQTPDWVKDQTKDETLNEGDKTE